MPITTHNKNTGWSAYNKWFIIWTPWIVLMEFFYYFTIWNRYIIVLSMMCCPLSQVLLSVFNSRAQSTLLTGSVFLTPCQYSQSFICVMYCNYFACHPTLNVMWCNAEHSLCTQDLNFSQSPISCKLLTLKYQVSLEIFFCTGQWLISDIQYRTDTGAAPCVLGDLIVH